MPDARANMTFHQTEELLQYTPWIVADDARRAGTMVYCGVDKGEPVYLSPDDYLAEVERNLGRPLPPLPPVLPPRRR